MIYRQIINWLFQKIVVQWFSGWRRQRRKIHVSTVIQWTTILSFGGFVPFFTLAVEVALKRPVWTQVYDQCLKFCSFVHTVHSGKCFGVKMDPTYTDRNCNLKTAPWLLRHSIKMSCFEILNLVDAKESASPTWAGWSFPPKPIKQIRLLHMYMVVSSQGSHHNHSLFSDGSWYQMMNSNNLGVVKSGWNHYCRSKVRGNWNFTFQDHSSQKTYCQCASFLCLGTRKPIFLLHKLTWVKLGLYHFLVPKMVTT